MIGVERAFFKFTVVFGIIVSLHSLKFCFNCSLLPGGEYTVANCTKCDEPYESKESLAPAGFFSPSTLHTIRIEDTNDDENCRAACSLRLTYNCSEPGRVTCPSVLCTSAKPVVAFEDLAEGEYTVSVHCEESGTSCYARPQEFSFLVSPKSGNSLREIQVLEIKLYKKITGRCSNEQVSKSRLSCLGLLLILLGVVSLVISLRVRYEDEIMPPPVFIRPPILEEVKWVLQVRPRT